MGCGYVGHSVVGDVCVRYGGCGGWVGDLCAGHYLTYIVYSNFLKASYEEQEMLSK